MATDFLPSPICASAFSPVNWSKTRTLSISALSAPAAAFTSVIASIPLSTTKAKSRSTGCRLDASSALRVGTLALGSGTFGTWTVKATAGPFTPISRSTLG